MTWPARCGGNMKDFFVLKTIEENYETAQSQARAVTLGFFGLAMFMLVLVTALVCSSIVADGLRDAGVESSKNFVRAIDYQIQLQKLRLEVRPKA